MVSEAYTHVSVVDDPQVHQTWDEVFDTRRAGEFVIFIHFAGSSSAARNNLANIVPVHCEKIKKKHKKLRGGKTSAGGFLILNVTNYFEPGHCAQQ
jgi:hypothetical protein